MSGQLSSSAAAFIDRWIVAFADLELPSVRALCTLTGRVESYGKQTLRNALLPAWFNATRRNRQSEAELGDLPIPSTLIVSDGELLVVGNPGRRSPAWVAKWWDRRAVEVQATPYRAMGQAGYNLDIAAPDGTYAVSASYQSSHADWREVVEHCIAHLVP